jgi:hypothetical protein
MAARTRRFLPEAIHDTSIHDNSHPGQVLRGGVPRSRGRTPPGPPQLTRRPGESDRSARESGLKRRSVGPEVDLPGAQRPGVRRGEITHAQLPRAIDCLAGEG